MPEDGDADSGDLVHPDHSPVSADFYRILVANTSEGLLTIDEDSTIVFANPAIEDVLGYEPEELIGRSKLEIIPERLRPVHERQLTRYIETGEKNIDWNGVELPALHEDGHEVPVTISLREHQYRGQRLFTGIFRDISDRKRQEERLQKQNDRLEKFASVLSHDLRNPLNVAQSYTTLLSEDIDREELGEVSFALDRMERLIEDMLTLSQEGKTVGRVEELSLESVATESWQWVNTREATLVLEDELGTVRADRSRLGSLLENLFRNAVEHGGLAVTVTVGCPESDAGFYVADDGPGIPAANRCRIFEQGYTTDSDGTGIGLSIVDRIADAHGWTIRLVESDDGGARFEFYV